MLCTRFTGGDVHERLGEAMKKATELFCLLKILLEAF
jgi:hypothetical protein